MNQNFLYNTEVIKWTLNMIRIKLDGSIKKKHIRILLSIQISYFQETIDWLEPLVLIR